MSQIIRTRIEPRSTQFTKNRESNLESIDTLGEAHKAALAGGGQKYVDRHLSRGKLLPRTRIEMLLDRDSPFLELCALAGHRVGGGLKTGASIIGGIGVVSGVECMVIATESTIKGGAMNEYSVLK
ncbi:MAG: carboxyl transferase domain-containing protein, partial [Bradymonadia bacterium]